MVASALAYSAFFAIPSVLLVATGAFGLLADPQTITDLMDRLRTVAPRETVDLLGGSLQRLNDRPATSLLVTLAGLALALWSTTSAMTTCMAALNVAYDRQDSRSFVRRRLIAIAMVGCIGAAVALVGVFLILGPHVEHWLGAAIGAERAVALVWWIGQWPVLIAGLLAAFATILYLGPDTDQQSWRLLTPGSVVTLLVWLAASAGFSAYAALFASYNKTWGSLSAVIVTLTWLWLTGIALLFGGEVNAEAERSRSRPRAPAAQRR